jgi:hypothetical protein
VCVCVCVCVCKWKANMKKAEHDEYLMSNSPFLLRVRVLDDLWILVKNGRTG